MRTLPVLSLALHPPSPAHASRAVTASCVVSRPSHSREGASRGGNVSRYSALKPSHKGLLGKATFQNLIFPFWHVTGNSAESSPPSSSMPAVVCSPDSSPNLEPGATKGSFHQHVKGKALSSLMGVGC